MAPRRQTAIDSRQTLPLNRTTLAITTRRLRRLFMRAARIACSFCPYAWRFHPFAVDDPLDKYNVVWTSPSKDCNGSMPIGNGEMGLNVWVEPSGDLVLLCGRTDSWNDRDAAYARSAACGSSSRRR